MNDSSSLPNIASLMNAQYKMAIKYLNRGFIVKGGIFLLNLIIIFTPLIGSINYIIWSVFAISVLALVLDNNFYTKFRSAYEIGEKIRKIDLVKKVFPEIHNRTEQAYLLSQLDDKVIEFAKKNPRPASEYFSDRKEKLEILSEHIQENSFWTSSLMELYAKRVRNFIVIIFVTIFISATVAFYLLGEYGGTNENLNLNISQYLALLVNTVFAFNVISYYNAFAKKSKQLQEIDKKLSREKNNPSLEHVIVNFAEYNCILYEAYPTPDSVYKRLGDRLNEVWRLRVELD